MPRKISKTVTGKRRSKKSRTTQARPGAATRVKTRVSRTSPGRRAAPAKKNVAKTSLGISANFWTRVPYFPFSEFALEARRPDDLLVFTLKVKNLKVASDQPPRLVKVDTSASSVVILELPPQHFGEEAFLDATGPEVVSIPDTQDENAEAFQETDPGGEVDNKNVHTSQKENIGSLPASKMRMSGTSRIAFTMPEEITSLALNFEDVLAACSTWPMRLSSLAVPPPSTTLVAASHYDWVKELTQMSAWQDAMEVTAAHMRRTVSAAASKAIGAAAGRVAKQFSAKQRGRRGATSQRFLGRLVNAEIQGLQRRFAGLRKDEPLELAQVMLALHLTKKISASRADLLVDVIEAIDGIKMLLYPHQPPTHVTALELPYRLITTPLPGSRWQHSTNTVKQKHRTELWHTRLSPKSTTAKAGKTPIRAIWSPDYLLDGIIDAVNSNPPKPYRMSLDPVDREMLVKLMAGFHLKQASSSRRASSYLPLPARADRLILSSLGGLLDAEGSWKAESLPAGVGLEQWRHLAALGRDQYVRVVYRGFLFPFGHSASLIKVTERKFENHTNKLNQRVAVLRQRFFIVVREVSRRYTGQGHTHQGRNFPFKTIHIRTRVTPNLSAPEESAVEEADNHPLFDSLPMRTCFWPSLIKDVNFEFELGGTDLDGQESSFSMPLLFVGLEANAERAPAVRAAYNAATAGQRQTDLTGSSVCYAPMPTSAAAEGDPRLPTGLMQFLTANNSAAGINDPRVYPEMESSDVGILAVQRLLNDPNATLTVRYPQVYKDAGFTTGTGTDNPGELFLEAATPFAMAFGEGQAKSDSLGAIAAPSMDIGGLSRVIGSTGDAAKVAKNTFDPAAFFKDAKILGGITIADLIGTLDNLGDAPKMLSREVAGNVEASFNWSTVITDSDPAKLFVHTPSGKPTEFSMQGLVTTPIGQPDTATYSSDARLLNFKVNLFGFIIIWFDMLKFSSKSGSKADVVVELHPDSATEKSVAFGGPLEFVNQIAEIIPMDGFSDPPNITVSPSGIAASYSLAIPSVQVGIFALSNMSIGAGFALPFNNEPMQVTFNFSEKQNPFSLTVSLFGGGGFFGIGIGTEGVNEIEAALEFGAAIAIDLGVASGGIEVKGGVYFHWLQDSVELGGYVRLHGELSVIGLISASLTFNLQLSYLKDNGQSIVWGEASLIIEVEVLVFSASVEVHCKREFSGSESDPTFLDLIPNEAVWADYCGAFALEEAA